MSHRTQVSTTPLAQWYDYIVVGGGTAGPVVARRLADGDPGASVLLIEAGPIDESLNTRMVMGWQNIIGTAYDWGYETIPQRHANNRVMEITRGKFLGGTSAINGTVMVRGPKADYDRWEKAGCTGWGWDDVLPYFKKSETFHPTSDVPDSVYHGTSGPLHTTVHPLAPISSNLIQSFREKGFEYKISITESRPNFRTSPDMFAEGEFEGVGNVVRTVHAGIRTTGADFVCSDKAPPNLTVLTSVLVLRIHLNGSPSTAPPRAIAVEVEGNSSQTSIAGTASTNLITAQREIILCAGTYNSPTLLMHSGIGPRMHLEDVQIKCLVDLKGVGSNLQDHLKVNNFYRLNQHNLTYDHLIYPPGALELAVKEWEETQDGVASRSPYGLFAYKRMDNLMKDTLEWKEGQVATGLEDPTGQLQTQPHVEYFNSELYGGDPQFSDLPSAPEHSVFSLVTMLCGLQSRGTVRLPRSTTSSPDPHAPPVIDHAYLTSSLDVAVLAEGCRLAHEIVLKGNATKDYIAGAWPEGQAYPQTLQEWKDYVKQNAETCYHGAGTCKMGPEDDEWAVVDEKLRVKGVQGLRVADCSIMPWVNNGHTQAPAYMIGEKCAALILRDHGVMQ